MHAHPAPTPATTAPRPRAAGDHRPQVDPACAGCALVLLLRALRRNGVAAPGRLSCEPGSSPFLVDAERGRGRLLVSAGPEAPGPEVTGLATAGTVERVDLGDPAGIEAALSRAEGRQGVTWLVAVAPCVIGRAPVGPPLRVLEARCNRCGACLSLGCPAIRDAGGEALVVDPAVCTGCGLCAPLCRARALVAGG